MFESLTDKLSSALRNLRGVGKLSEENMATALNEVRTALLAADVHSRWPASSRSGSRRSARARRS